MTSERRLLQLALFCILGSILLCVAVIAFGCSIAGSNLLHQSAAVGTRGGSNDRSDQRVDASGPRQGSRNQEKPSQSAPKGQAIPYSAEGLDVLLGSPTADSIKVSVLSDKGMDIYIEYGITSGVYSAKSTVQGAVAGVPVVVTLSGLQPDTRYYYRLNHRQQGDDAFTYGDEYTFYTRRAPGSSFTFTVQADSHRDQNTSDQIYRTTLANIQQDKPDFHIDLGDTFMGDKWARSKLALSERYIQERTFFTIPCRSASLFLANGNHEGENGWLLKGGPDSLPAWATACRKLYYPLPDPGSFYSGDSKPEQSVGIRQSYYSWIWGDALFVVLDPFWYTVSSRSPSGWDWTLGKEQYDWLTSLLQNSQAKYKFIFCHNLAGGFDLSSAGNGRGGAEAVTLYEWGGLNADGTPGFAANRQGWGKPVHQLLRDNHVTILFHGHDHFFGRQELDSVVYQECPQPGALNSNDHAAEYGYKEGVFLGGAGYMRIEVSNQAVTVDFVKTYLPGSAPVGHQNAELAYSYALSSAGKGK